MSHANTHRIRPHGFTLIELLVVISIISLMVSLLLPALGAARASAQRMSCLTRIRQMGFMFHLYANDFDGSLPYLVNRTQHKHSYGVEAGLIREYVGYSPSSGQMDQDYVMYHCPMQERGPTFWSYNYGYNYYLPNDRLKIDQHRQTSKTALLVERGVTLGDGLDYGYPYYAVRIGALATSNREYNSYRQVGLRHRNQSVNVAYLDGHVSAMSDYRDLAMPSTDDFWYSTPD